jgi:hypothetical protein
MNRLPVCVLAGIATEAQIRVRKIGSSGALRLLCQLFERLSFYVLTQTMEYGADRQFCARHDRPTELVSEVSEALLTDPLILVVGSHVSAIELVVATRTTPDLRETELAVIVVPVRTFGEPSRSAQRATGEVPLPSHQSPVTAVSHRPTSFHDDDTGADRQIGAAVLAPSRAGLIEGSSAVPSRG